MVAAITDSEAREAAQAWVGARRGRRVVESVGRMRATERYRRVFLLRMRCDCGGLDGVWAPDPVYIHSMRCAGCAEREKRADVMERRRALQALRAMDPDIWTDEGPDGHAAEVLVTREFGPLSNADAAILLGLSRERIRQIGDRAMAKLRREAAANRTPAERALEVAS